jgi:hypothetical protein
MWILARPKVKYYGAYPNGFLERARPLLGVHIEDPILHVCGGMTKNYPGWGVGPNDKTLDLDPSLEPDYLQDAREPFPAYHSGELSDDLPMEVRSPWVGIMIDRPYSQDDADHYAPGRDVLPSPSLLVRNALDVLPVGCKVGILDYEWARPPKDIPHKLIATVGVLMGYGNNIRVFSVYERR